MNAAAVIRRETRRLRDGRIPLLDAIEMIDRCALATAKEQGWAEEKLTQELWNGRALVQQVYDESVLN